MMTPQRSFDAGNATEQCRLARTRRTEEHDERSRFDREVTVVQRHLDVTSTDVQQLLAFFVTLRLE
jgi:hypothetical protein